MNAFEILSDEGRKGQLDLPLHPTVFEIWDVEAAYVERVVVGWAAMYAALDDSRGRYLAASPLGDPHAYGQILGGFDE